MIKIDNLPNYYNGKIYKKWSSVYSLFGKGSIIASKNNSDGSVTQLLITKNGNKRELFFSDGKIMDLIEPNGTKRVYKYQRIDNNTIKGEMFVSPNNKGENPLVIKAKWILKNMIPEKFILKINKNHPDSNIFVSKVTSDDKSVNIKKTKKMHVQNILLKDFDNGYYSLPKTIYLRSVSGSSDMITETKDSFNIIKHFDIESDLLGKNFRTVV